MILLEVAFVGVEEQVVIVEYFQHPSDYRAMPLEMLLMGFAWQGGSVHCHVVHVYSEISFGDQFSEECVHHGLEGRGQVSESEEHHSGLVESLFCSEGSLPSVLRYDLYPIVSPFYVAYHNNGTST